MTAEIGKSSNAWAGCDNLISGQRQARYDKDGHEKSRTGLRSMKAAAGKHEGKLQAEQFWRKNGFRETGVTYNSDDYTVIVARKDI